MDSLYQIIAHAMTFCLFAVVFLLAVIGILYIVGNKKAAIKRTAKVALILAILTAVFFVAGVLRAHAVLA